ncbi:MAG: asparagine synthase (glutamine-hydrolyzing) [Elusimicrobia bacterium GWA2_56_46]|nr:MAG: asparagine synthase (glutamine-hydrolyzing) [Elusimicrobia bacterium GWA2_56_46]OGR54596.1 MAG: asparagine synthase (glutamine-hydrolyzing) [Elusimicrobia bacterium GWC2_56_31]HBW23922.1 asparagine synthase (glutamine-hydrolyzing) [Elusimicrobiota bacterium]
MCGICGFSNYKNEPLLRAMTARLIHRGPDEDGFFMSGGKVSLGMRRLKIIDLATGSQPIANEDGTVTVVFNGEIYNFKELRAELEAKGHRFRTSSDTEVLVHLYEEYGESFPVRLRGMFAFAIWDARTETLLLARDQFGIKPLFYAVAGEKLFFASEIKSLLLCAEIPDELDLTALDAYFTRLYIPSPLTAYKHIKKLEPARTLVFRGGAARIAAYWSLPEYGLSPAGSEREYLEGIDDLLGKSVSEQLVSDVPLGLLLSGGMDSSSALYYMSRAAKEPIKTFTVGYGAKDASFNETAKARILSAHFKTEHHETFLEPDPRAVMEKLAEQFDEPFADASAIPTYLVTAEARKKVTVALTGIGGDEMFGGYPRHLGARLLPAYLKLPGLVREGLWAGVSHIPESTGSKNLPGRFKRFISGGRGDFRAAYKSWLSYFTREERVKLYASGLAPGLGVPEYALPGRLESPDDIFAFEVRNYLSDDLLCLADRTSMANSLELRVPFLDVRLAELMAGAPLALKTRGFRLKYLLKKVMAGRLPAEISKGGKRGFQVPLARWYKEEMNDFAREVLGPAALKKSGYLSPVYVSALLKEHESGRWNLNDQIHAAMMFELWLQKRKTASGAGISGPSVVSAGSGKRILLLNMAGLGDIVMMTPLLRSLKAAYPASRISLLTIDRSADLASRLPGLDEVFSIPVHYRLPDPAGLWRLLKTLFALRNKNFDVLLNVKLVSSEAGAWKIRLINAFIRPGFSAGRCLYGGPDVYDATLREGVIEKKSQVELAAGLLKPLGIETVDFNIRLDVREEDAAFAGKELERLGLSGARLIGFNPGAFRPSRRWPLENWKALAGLLLAKYPDARVAVSGSREEAEAYAGLAAGGRVVILDGTYDMGKLAALFKKMDLFITNDTGPMHIAAAVGTKVAAIFGPGDADRFAPSVPEKQYRVIRKDAPGCERPCYKFNCPDPVCLTSITPAEVFEKAAELLDE